MANIARYSKAPMVGLFIIGFQIPGIQGVSQ